MCERGAEQRILHVLAGKPVEIVRNETRGRPPIP